MAAHLAFLGISGYPVRAREVEQLLIGTSMDEQTLNHAAALAQTLVSDDMEDVHATVDYRRALTAELTKRVLKTAWRQREH
jgi:carbon-monoxide dehydrogenase medium subunit